jgi:hypothetical protein
MVTWAGGLGRRYIYIPDAAGVAERFYDALVAQFKARGDLLYTGIIKISKGFFKKKERLAMRIQPKESSGMSDELSATITAIPIGPDLYIGYYFGFSLKGEVDEMERQDLEAFSSYLEHAITLALQSLRIKVSA